MSRPLIFGSSHIGPLMKAPGEVPFDFKKITDFDPEHRLAQTVDGKVELRAEIRAWLDQNPCRDMVLSISGHNYLTLCLTEGDAPYDVILPWRPELAAEPAVQLVPFAEIHALLAAEVQYILDGIEALAAWRPPGVRLWWLEAPPPIGDEAYLLDWLATGNRHWKAFLNGRFSSPWLRMKLYLLQQRLIEDRCVACGVDYIVHPPAITDENGFLRTDYALDVCHGNRAYGRLAVDSVLDAFQRGHRGG